MAVEEKIFFSVITPVKNGSNYINRYINCLKSQIYNKWEAILVVEDSEDESYKILKIKTYNDKRFKIIKNKEKKLLNSPYNSRNIGLDNAKGRYICFLDIDDFWLPNKLLRQFQLISKNKKIILLFSSYYRYKEGKNYSNIRNPLVLFGVKKIINFINPVPMLTSCIRKREVSNIRFKPIYHEDYIFWKELIRNIPSKNIFVDDQPNSIYNISSNSLSSNKFKTIRWIYNIYYLENRNFILSILKIFIRAIFQIFIYSFDQRINKSFNYL